MSSHLAGKRDRNQSDYAYQQVRSMITSGDLPPGTRLKEADLAERLEAVSKLFDSLNYKSVLKRGYALVRDAEGQPLRSADAVLDGQPLVLEFADGKVDATGGRIGSRPKPPKPRLVAAEEQGALF